MFPILTALFGLYMFIIPWFGDDVKLNALWVAITVFGGIPVYFASVNKKHRLRQLVNFSGRIICSRLKRYKVCFQLDEITVAALGEFFLLRNFLLDYVTSTVGKLLNSEVNLQ